MKEIKLIELKTAMGESFRKATTDEDGNAIMDIIRDSDGKDVTEVVRNREGEIIGLQTAHRTRTEKMGREALLELLKSFYMRIPADKFTRNDSIQGLSMMRSIQEAEKDSRKVLKLEEGVHDWLKNRLKEEKVGPVIFGVNLHVIEEALDDFERPHDKGDKNAES